MTDAPLHLAHQFGATMNDWLRDRLPAGARIDSLPADAPWRVDPGTQVVLVTNGKLRSLPRQRPGWAEGVRWMHLRPTGVDEAPDWLFDLPHLTVSRGAAAVAIAEHVMATLLNFERRLPDLRVRSPLDWAPAGTGGLAGKSVGLFGFGEIGQAVARRARAFGMTLRATRRSPGPAPEETEIVPLTDLCALSNHLVLCAPLTDETRGIFDDARFATCRPGQHLVNVARGALIQPEALARALDGGPIARASLDVWTQEPPPAGHWVYDHPKVHLTPHSSFRGPSTEARLTEILAANLRAWVAGRPQALFGRINSDRRY